VIATDISREALALAQENARRLDLGNVTFVESDWYASLPDPQARFDAIACNPPYVDAADPHLGAGDLRYEPSRALTPGDGLTALRKVIDGAPMRLIAGGNARRRARLRSGRGGARAVRGSGIGRRALDARSRRHSARRFRSRVARVAHVRNPGRHQPTAVGPIRRTETSTPP
jgi:release factor glutamine methyltransferase